jgi:ATP-dependent exoDNAse (exonuclease V) alpha subunit
MFLTLGKTTLRLSFRVRIHPRERIESAQKANARVVLVGDVKQLGSVEAGAAFAQLQGAGMETAKLAEIVRRTNPLTKEAVEASNQGDARR